MDAKATTQEQLAAATGVSQGSVHKWLKGSMPGSSELLQIARFFGTSMEALLSDDVRQEEPISVSAWKHRALNAEQKLEALKSGLVALVKKY